MELRILGPLQAVDGAVPIDLGGRRARVVLAALALEPGQVIPVERLAATVWETDPPASMRTQIAIAISLLRRRLHRNGHELIETVRPGYRIRAESVSIDAREALETITRARAAASAGQDGRAVELLRAALSLWRGPVLAELESPALAAGALCWQEMRLALAVDLAELELARGQHHRLIAELRPLAAEHPYHEHLRAQLMTALCRSGRQAEALAVYHESRRILAEELGLEPGPALQTLHSAILRRDPAAHANPSAFRRATDAAQTLLASPQ